MERPVQQRFLKGINRRFSIQNQDDPTRLYTLQNARLQKRGETGQVSRISGYQELVSGTTIAGTIHDTVMYKSQLVCLSHVGGTDAVVTIVDVDTGSVVTTFNFPETDLGYGELTLLEDTIFITPYNRMLNNYLGTWRLNDFKSKTPILRLSQVATIDGFLEQEATYWYMGRMKYADNHKTITSFPQKIKIDTKRFVELNIDTPLDLDLGDVRIEIFRRREEENFFLIDRARVDSQSGWIYTDTGRPKIQAYSGQNYVWNETEADAEIVRDRLVRAGVTFADRDYSPDATVTLATTTDDETLVPGAQFSLYARKRFPDGILSPHALVDTIEGEDGKTFNINQPTAVDREVGFYMGFDRPFVPTDSIIQFPTLEIYNQETPSLETKDDPEIDQERPFDPHVFVGFAQILRQFHNGNTIRHGIRDYYWGGDSVTGFVWFDESAESPVGLDNIMPVYITIEVVEGVLVKYKRIATNQNDGTVTQGVYQIAWLDGLKEYIRIQDIESQIDSIDAGFSSSVSTEDAVDNPVRIVGYEDQTDIFPKPYRTESTIEIGLEFRNRAYLVFSRESFLAQFDSVTFNNDGVLGDWTLADTPDLSSRAIFELLNIEYVEDATPVGTSQTIDGLFHYVWEYDDQVTQPVPNFGFNDSVVYLGSTNTAGTELYPAGIEKVSENGFTYWRLPEHAIFETLIQSEDLEIFQENFPTLLIWSEPFVLGTGVNGIRNFTFTNFKSISQDYGPIINIEYINNRLLAFCERGVNMINVGETLTQQASGEVFVSSAQFLTTDQWVLKNLPNIQVNSIVQYENMLFMCDGRDVWMFTDSFQNITNGSIELDGDIVSAGVDVKHKEYRITDQSQTWAYSIEVGEWMGPYTYTDNMPVNYRDRYFSIKNGTFIEHNSGNTFLGVEYDTIIDSVSIDLQNVSYDKLWRKFLVQTDNIPGTPTTEVLEFQYGKEYLNKLTKNLFDMPKKSGLFHIGIHPDHQNATQLYWRIRTDIEDFVLRAFAFNFHTRKRP